MTLDDYLTPKGAVPPKELAEQLGLKTSAMVRQWLSTAKKKRRPGAGYCAEIERVTNGQVRRQDLRPHDWQRIWPELVQEDAS